MCKYIETETTTIKYLGKGHSFVAADAIHGNIGRLFCKAGTVATFDDCIQLCKKASNNIKMMVLDLPFIYPIYKKHTQDHRPKIKCLLWKV